MIDQSIWRRSPTGMPACVASATLLGSSSKATISAPPAVSARQVARPELPSPNTATRFPAIVVTGIKTLPQLEGGEPGERQHHRDDPEADDDLRLGPAELLEMMVDRRHPEHALAGEPERQHLHDHRHRFQHEQAADAAEHDLVLG